MGRILIGRRQFLATTGALGASLSLPFYNRALAQDGAPIKIGSLQPMSGAQGNEGNAHNNGFKLFLELNGNQVAGRRIELLEADDEMKPQVGIQKLRRFIESDNVDFVVGPASSGVALSITDYINQTGKVWVISGAALASLTREKKSPLFFRTSTTTWQTNHPAGVWAAENAAKKAVLIAPDYAGGRDSMTEFKQAFEASGGEIIKEVYPPMGSKDLSAYLTAIRAMNPPMVYAFYAGLDAVTFIQQYEQFGLKDKILLVVSGFAVDSEVLGAIGKAALGVVSALHYTPELDTPVNKTFVDAYQKKFNKKPGYSAEYGYTAAAVITEALKQVGGNTGDQAKFMDALRGVRLDVPRGPFRFDPKTQNVIQNIYIRKVIERDGALGNEIISTIKDVTDPG